MNLGMDYFEGDIKLTRQQSDAIAASLQRNSSLEVRALVRDVQKLWPDGEVPYVIADGLRENIPSFSPIVFYSSLSKPPKLYTLLYLSAIARTTF